MSLCSSCVYFTVIRTQHSAAVHSVCSTHNLTVALLGVCYCLTARSNNKRLVSGQMSVEHNRLVFNKENKNYFAYILPLYTLIRITFKQPKHVAGIYKCYIKVVHSQIIYIYFFCYLLAFWFKVFMFVAPIYRQSLHSSADSNICCTRYERSQVTD